MSGNANHQGLFSPEEVEQIKDSLPSWIYPKFSWRKLGMSTLRSVGTTIRPDKPRFASVICIPASGDPPRIVVLPLTLDDMTGGGMQPNTKAEKVIFNPKIGMPDLRLLWLAQATATREEEPPTGGRLRRRAWDPEEAFKTGVWASREFARAVFEPEIDPMYRTSPIAQRYLAMGVPVSRGSHPVKYYAYRSKHPALPPNTSPLLTANPDYAGVRGDAFIVVMAAFYSMHEHQSRIAALGRNDDSLPDWLRSEAGLQALSRVLADMDWKNEWSWTPREISEREAEEEMYAAAYENGASTG